MASAYGIVHQYGEPQSNFDPQLAAGVLQHKQQKYDANIVKVEQTLGKLGLTTSMLVRPEDQKYLTEKVSNLINSIPNAKDIDYSSNEATREILSQVNQAVDDKVVKHLGISKRIRDFKAGIQKLKEDNREKYSKRNHMYALKKAGLQEYMNSDTDSLKSGLQYIPYNDYHTELTEKVKNIKDLVGETVTDGYDKNGNPIKVKVNNLTEAQLLDKMPGLIDEQMRSQMKIDGAYKYRFSDDKAQAQAQKSLDKQIAAYDKKINTYRSLIKNKNLSDSKREEFERELETFEEKKREVENNFNVDNITAETLGFKEVYNTTISNMAKIAGSDPSRTFLDPEKYKRKGNNTADRESMLDAIGASPPTDITTSDLDDVDEETGKKRYEQSKSAMNKWIRKGSTQAQKTPTNKFDYDATYSGYIDSGYSESDAKKETVFDYYNATNNIDRIKEGKALERDYKHANEVQKQTHNEFSSEGVWKQNADKLYEAFMEKGIFDRQKIVVDGEEIPASDYLKEKMDGTGKDAMLKFLSDEDKSREFKKQVYSDLFLFDENLNWLGNETNMSSVIKNGQAKTANITKSLLHNFDRYSQLFGKKNTDFTDIFDVRRKKRTLGNTVNPGATPETSRQIAGIHLEEEPLSMKEISEIANSQKFTSDLVISVREDSDPDIVEGLKKRVKFQSGLGIQGTNTVLSALKNVDEEVVGLMRGDNNFYDDKDIRELFSYNSEQYQEKYTEALKNSIVSVNTPTEVTIRRAVGNADEKQLTSIKELTNLLSSNALVTEDSDQRFTYQPDTPSNIMLDPNNPNNVIITQMISKNKENEEGGLTQKTGELKAVVNKSVFRQKAPTLSSMIDLSGNRGSLNFSKEVEEEKDNIGYGNAEDKERVENTLQVLQNVGLTNKAFDQSAEDYLMNKHFDLLQQNPEIEAINNVVISNSDRFKVKLKSNKEGKGYAEIYVSPQEQEPYNGERDYDLLTSIKIQPDYIDKAIEILDVAPQVYITDALDRIATNYRNSGKTDLTANKSYKKLIQTFF